MFHKLIKFFSRKPQEDNSKKAELKETTLRIDISLSKVYIDVISSGDENIDKKEYTGIVMAIMAMPDAVSEHISIDFLKRYPEMASVIDRLTIKEEPVVRASEVWSSFKIK